MDKNITKKIWSIFLVFAMIFGLGTGFVSNQTIANASQTGVTYTTHVQKKCWMSWVQDGAMSGTSGQSLRLEAFKLKLKNAEYEGDIEYRAFFHSYGWLSWKKNGELAGTSGEGKRMESIQIRLTGEIAQRYDIYYRVHAQSYGWLGWAKNGERAGTSDYAKRLEAIEVELMPKDVYVQNYGVKSYIYPRIQYRTHVQKIGWQNYVKEGETSGTSGQAKRLEGINIALTHQQYTGDITYRTHVQTYGWQGWKSNGAMSGTSGQAKRLEAIEIKLTGEMEKHYDIYYRVHAQKFGWMGWAKNGESAGTAGYGYRLEAIQIQLVDKGDYAPGSTINAFDDGSIYNRIPNGAYVKEVIRLVNIERQRYGLSAVSTTEQLSKAADVRAHEIINTFAHTRPDGSDCFTILSQYGIFYMAAGENIAWGYRSPQAVVDGWMNSPGHRANILNEDFHRMGVGVVPSQWTWVQVFTD